MVKGADETPTGSYQLRFRRYVRLLALISALMIVLLAGSLIFVFENNMHEEVSRRALEVLKKNSQFPSFYNEISRTVSSQLYLSEAVQDVLPSTTLARTQRIQLLTAMKRVASSMPFLDSVSFYHAPSDLVLISHKGVQNIVMPKEEFPDRSYVDLLDRYREYPNFRPILRRGRIFGVGGETYVYTYLMYNFYPARGLNFVIALNFLEEDFASFVEVDTAEGGLQYAVDNAGVVQLGNQRYEPLTDLSERPYVRKIISSPLQAGYFIADAAEGLPHLVTFYRSSETGWIFVSEHAYRSIARAVAGMRITLVVIVLVVLALLLFLSLPLNRRVLTATRSMVSEMVVLEQERRELRQVARRKLLQDLVSGTGSPEAAFHYIEDEAVNGEAERESTDHSGKTGRRDFLLAMTKACSVPADEALDVWHLSVQMQSVLGDRATIAEHVEYGPSTFLYLLRLSGAPAEVHAEARADATVSAVREALRHTAALAGYSIGLSSVADTIIEMNRWSEEVHGLSHALFFSRGGELLSAGAASQRHDFLYPEELERAMLESLLGCDASACKKHIRSIILGTREYDQIALQMAAYRVIYEIKKALAAGRVLESRVEGLMPLVVRMSQESDVHTFATVYALLDRLDAVVDSACSVLSVRRQTKRQRLVAQIDELIANHYRDQSFHLGEIARMVDLNPRYLSRVYKQETGESVPKRLVRVRLESVKRELRRSARPIREILRDSGMAENPYFFKVFKDYTGTTPRQYRNLCEQKQ